ncbi:MAG: YggT family protein [Magnetococcales bacterium]|nr:YggT family protein [Magnetococcales bacterium]
MGITGSIGTLLNLFLEIYSWMILARLLLSWINPDPFHPIVQFLVQTTNPVLEPFRRLIPPLGGMDFSPIFALMAVHFVQRLLVTLLVGGMGGGAITGLLAELLGLVHLLLTLYLLLLLARGGYHVYSWHTFRQGKPPAIDLRKPLVRFIFQATEPVIRPFRYRVPTFSGLDITPLVAAVILLFGLFLLQEGMAGMAGGHMLLPH